LSGRVLLIDQRFSSTLEPGIFAPEPDWAYCFNYRNWQCRHLDRAYCRPCELHVNHVFVVALASQNGADMADDIMRFLAQFDASKAAAKQTKASEAEVAECIIAIFKKLILADNAIKVAEIAAVTEIIKTEYSQPHSSNPDAAAEFDLERMMKVDERSLASIALILRQSLSTDQLDKLRDNLVSVALTDGELHPFEEDLINLFVELTRHPRV